MTIKHGKADHPLYMVWKSMMRRCYVSSAFNYHLYGGRGIRVCERWHDVRNFCDDLEGLYSPELSIDRIDNDGDYMPGNVRFVGMKVQGSNRRNNHKLLVLGEDMTLTQASERFGVNITTIWRRLDQGWDEELAATAPAREYRMGTITVHGEELTQADAARKYNIDSGTLCARLKQGMSPEDAVSKPVAHKPHKGRRYSINGEQLTITEMSKKYGIHVNTLRQRMFKNGATPEQAVSWVRGQHFPQTK